MNLEVTENGNLRISLADAADREWLGNQLADERNQDDSLFLSELLEHTGWQPNGRLYQVNPETIAALTEAPLLSDDVVFEDNGAVTVRGKVWWYPDYMVSHFGEQLAKHGSVLFRAAH